jgi:hypothetical protein
MFQPSVDLSLLLLLSLPLLSSTSFLRLSSLHRRLRYHSIPSSLFLILLVPSLSFHYISSNYSVDVLDNTSHLPLRNSEPDSIFER